MNSVAFLCLLGLAASRNQTFLSFEEFKTLYGKNYIGDEEIKRREIYSQNLASYAIWNAEDTAAYGVDEFSDLSFSEWRLAHGIMGMVSPQDGGPDQCNFENSSIGIFASSIRARGVDIDDIDWVARGAVTPAKNQGSFGTCGYFSSIAVMEGINVVQGRNDLVSLSEQQIIDCCTTGCNGWPGEEIMYYAHHHVSAVTEASYPYEGSSSACKSGTATTASSSMRVCIPNDAEQVLAHLKTLGPAVWMIASGCLQGYRGGIISSSRCSGSPGTWPHYSGIDHATTLVGAGEENGISYWKVKNSWGANFGENGYYRVKRDAPGIPNPMLNAPGAIFGVYAAPKLVV